MSTRGSEGPHRADAAGQLELDVAQDEEKVKLIVRHPEIGLICELWCYEGGPLQRGSGIRHDDGRVVMVHQARGMSATSTFTPQPNGRVALDIVVEGPLEQLRQVQSMGPCMQFWHSEAFKRRGSLIEFASRCFIYTLRGPVGLLDTARGRQKGFATDAPENNPPCTQWHVPVGRAHPGDIWSFGASGDRPLHELVGVSSRDGAWLAAIGCEHNLTLGQGWHDCIHHVPWLPKYLQENTQRIDHRSMIYVMPNEPDKLLDAFRADFGGICAHPDIELEARGGVLIASAGKGAPRLELSLDVSGNSKPAASVWDRTRWGTWTRAAGRWRMWAAPARGSVELCVSHATTDERATATAKIEGAAWRPVEAPGTGAQVWQCADEPWTAALLWERTADNDPARAVLAAGADQERHVAVRGRLFLYEGKPAELTARMEVAGYQGNKLTPREDWAHAVPYRMPVSEDEPHPQQRLSVGFGPNEKEQTLAYGLSIMAPWKGGGVLHTNFPEHFEHGDVGYGILRHSDKRANPWKISPGSHAASYEVESLELPGVTVRATATADGDRAHLTLKIVNGGTKTLERVHPMLCFHYDRLTGFPQRLTDNFAHIRVVCAGQLVRLADIPTSNPQATGKVAHLRGRNNHRSDKFARGRGGLIEQDIDAALIAVTALDGKRKLVIAFTPGKSILSNAFIPCVHADPHFDPLAPGEEAEAKGIVIFTEDDLETVVKGLLERGFNEAAGQ